MDELNNYSSVWMRAFLSYKAHSFHRKSHSVMADISLIILSSMFLKTLDSCFLNLLCLWDVDTDMPSIRRARQTLKTLIVRIKISQLFVRLFILTTLRSSVTFKVSRGIGR